MTQSRSKQEVESMKQKQLKGFTLVELVVVMAIFSMIMFGAMQLMDPVSKIFQRTSNYETSAATVDNVKRYIEGSIRYADFINVYEGSYMQYDPATSGDVAITEEQAIDEFMKRYLDGACGVVDKKARPVTAQYLNYDVYVMEIDNTIYSTSGTEITDTSVGGIDANRGRGRITQRIYSVNSHAAGGVYPKTLTSSGLAINETYFRDTAIDVQLGLTDADTVSMANFTMRITNYRDVAKSGGVRTFSETATETNAAMSLVNVASNAGTNYYAFDDAGNVTVRTRGTDVFTCKRTDSKEHIFIIYAFEHQR